MNPEGLPREPGESQIALVSAPHVVLTGSQVSFGYQEEDARLAFERLRKSLEQAGVSAGDVAFAHYYPLSAGIAEQVRKVRSKFFDDAHPPAGSLVLFEGLPSMEAGFAVDAGGGEGLAPRRGRIGASAVMPMSLARLFAVLPLWGFLVPVLAAQGPAGTPAEQPTAQHPGVGERGHRAHHGDRRQRPLRLQPGSQGFPHSRRRPAAAHPILQSRPEAAHRGGVSHRHEQQHAGCTGRPIRTPSWSWSGTCCRATRSTPAT